MIPCSTVNNVPDSDAVDSVHVANALHRYFAFDVHRPNLQNLSFGHAAIPVSRSSRHPALKCCVREIVLGRSQKKMFWPDTGSIIAFVEHKLSFCNRSRIDYPRCDMGTHRNLMRSFSNSPITLWAYASSPHPTRSQFRLMRRHGTILVHLRPKPFRERFRKTLRSQVLRSNLDHSSVSTPFGLQAQRRFPLTMIARGLKEDQANYAQS